MFHGWAERGNWYEGESYRGFSRGAHQVDTLQVNTRIRVSLIARILHNEVTSEDM